MIMRLGLNHWGFLPRTEPGAVIQSKTKRLWRIHCVGRRGRNTHFPKAGGAAVLHSADGGDDAKRGTYGSDQQHPACSGFLVWCRLWFQLHGCHVPDEFSSMSSLMHGSLALLVISWTIQYSLNKFLFYL